ncbi:MAG: hypothetical protein HY925_10330 [Elusimicrobia bacterium]|nr:hypothetical protein [Elusimicrobiota bacterium]
MEVTARLAALVALISSLAAPSFAQMAATALPASAVGNAAGAAGAAARGGYDPLISFQQTQLMRTAAGLPALGAIHMRVGFDNPALGPLIRAHAAMEFMDGWKASLAARQEIAERASDGLQVDPMGTVYMVSMAEALVRDAERRYAGNTAETLKRAVVEMEVTAGKALAGRRVAEIEAELAPLRRLQGVEAQALLDSFFENSIGGVGGDRLGLVGAKEGGSAANATTLAKSVDASGQSRAAAVPEPAGAPESPGAWLPPYASKFWAAFNTLVGAATLVQAAAATGAAAVGGWALGIGFILDAATALSKRSTRLAATTRTILAVPVIAFAGGVMESAPLTAVAISAVYAIASYYRLLMTQQPRGLEDVDAIGRAVALFGGVSAAGSLVLLASGQLIIGVAGLILGIAVMSTGLDDSKENLG